MVTMATFTTAYANLNTLKATLSSLKISDRKPPCGSSLHKAKADTNVHLISSLSPYSSLITQPRHSLRDASSHVALDSRGPVERL